MNTEKLTNEYQLTSDNGHKITLEVNCKNKTLTIQSIDPDYKFTLLDLKPKFAVELADLINEAAMLGSGDLLEGADDE